MEGTRHSTTPAGLRTRCPLVHRTPELAARERRCSSGVSVLCPSTREVGVKGSDWGEGWSGTPHFCWQLVHCANRCIGSPSGSTTTTSTAGVWRRPIRTSLPVAAAAPSIPGLSARPLVSAHDAIWEMRVPNVRAGGRSGPERMRFRWRPKLPRRPSGPMGLQTSMQCPRRLLWHMWIGQGSLRLGVPRADVEHLRQLCSRPPLIRSLPRPSRPVLLCRCGPWSRPVRERPGFLLQVEAMLSVTRGGGPGICRVRRLRMGSARWQAVRGDPDGLWAGNAQARR
jgi:hypothetical protein